MNASFIQPGWDRPHGLWSLWDIMIDFHLRSFMEALSNLETAQTRARVANPEEFVSLEQLALIGDNLARIKGECSNLDMPISKHRLAKLMTLFRPGACSTNECLSHEIDELFNAVEIDARDQYFCHYRKDRITFILRMEEDWSLAFEAFPSIRAEVSAGVDCYALAHNTASIFHMARVGEIGLRVIGRERGVRELRRNVPIEWGTWGAVFKAIEPQIESIRKQRPNGPQKAAALAFYDAVLSDLHAIQSLYRDPTMHFRRAYDDGEAQSAMFRVKSLMTTLACKLNENSTRKISWSAWK